MVGKELPSINRARDKDYIYLGVTTAQSNLGQLTQEPRGQTATTAPGPRGRPAGGAARAAGAGLRSSALSSPSWLMRARQGEFPADPWVNRPAPVLWGPGRAPPRAGLAAACCRVQCAPYFDHVQSVLLQSNNILSSHNSKLQELQRDSSPTGTITTKQISALLSATPRRG